MADRLAHRPPDGPAGRPSGQLPGKRSGCPAERPAGWPAEWRSALLLTVPAAEPAVREHRAVLDPSSRDGVPAHVTVLYPFLAPALIDDGVLASLDRLFAGAGSFTFTLDRVAWFGDSVIWLGPRDPAPFRDLIASVCSAFPGCPPYGGEHAEPVPHLTIGDRNDPAALRAAGEAVRPWLPIHASATEVTLMTGPPPGNPATPPGQWRTLESFPLAGNS